MNTKNIKWFTLVELIVVITILAILWTIAFISLQGYSQDSRNSVRLTDSGLIKKALGLYITTNSRYPTPDNPTTLTYSGVTLWTQWTFWNNAFVTLKSLSNIPVDPLFENEYDYSVINNWTKFELWTIMEGWLLSYNNNLLINQASALSNNDVVSYISWDYTARDIYTKTWSNCTNITVPSLFINNPTAGDLAYNWTYKFVYNGWINIPNSYSGFIDLSATPINFWISEVYNKCSIDTLADLELYVSNLSSAYQQLNWVKEYSDLIFNSNTTHFKLTSANKLVDDWILVDETVFTTLRATAPELFFQDSFSWSNNAIIIWTHIADNLWTWIKLTWLSDYEILDNKLSKINWNTQMIIPSPSVPITSWDTRVSFVVKNITGDINIYWNYIDLNNYYMVKLKTTWYEIIQKVTWTLSILSNISQVLPTDAKIDFNISSNTIKFSINNIEKDRIVATEISWTTWIPWLEITNTWDQIDDYILYYK